MAESDAGLSQSSRLATIKARSAEMVGALRYPDYRRFWLGLLGSVSGLQMFWVAQGWLVYDLTGSPLYLGYVNLVSAIPAIILNFVGGVLADRVDVRRLIIYSQTCAAGLIALLATLAALHVVEVWHVLVISFLSGSVQAFNQPARQSLFPHLIDRKDLMNAVSLNSLVWQGTRPIAPALGGLLIAFAGPGVTFYVIAAAQLLMAVVMFGVRVPPIPASTGRSVARDMKVGVNFVRSNSIFSFLIGTTFFNAFFGMSFISLLPVFAKDILDVGASGLGFMYSVEGMGGLSGLILAALLSHYPHKGRLLITGAMLFGAFLVIFAFSNFILLTLLALYCGAMCSQLYMVVTQTTLQLLVPDEVRGRVMGLYGVAYNIQPLGAMQMGTIADIISAPVAVAVGGVAVAAYAMGVALPNPRIRQLAQEPVGAAT